MDEEFHMLCRRRWRSPSDAPRAPRRKPIRRVPSPSSCRSRPAARPTRSRASWPSACGHRSARPVMIENVTGAGGTIGVGRVVQRGARRLHPRASATGRAMSAPGAIYPLPYDVLNGSRPGVDARRHPADDRRQDRIAGQGSGADRLAQGQPGQGLGRRPSAPAAPRMSAASISREDRHPVPVRALSRRRRRRCRTWSPARST